MLVDNAHLKERKALLDAPATDSYGALVVYLEPAYPFERLRTAQCQRQSPWIAITLTLFKEMQPTLYLVMARGRCAIRTVPQFFLTSSRKSSSPTFRKQGFEFQGKRRNVNKNVSILIKSKIIVVNANPD